jgi:glycosyltransferase involved in cell wall biosynthesis
VLLYVGRFLAFKRLDALLRAYARARPAFAVPAPLVLVGGFPGEWEGEHPLQVIERLQVPDVFLAGWHSHGELPDLFRSSDVIVLPSVGEQFGLALVEGMACGLPGIAIDTDHGPRELIADGQTGWLTPPDDEARLAQALVQAVNDTCERERRGAAAMAAMHARYAWPSVGSRLAGLYESVL